jgi:hypothetical protein
MPAAEKRASNLSPERRNRTATRDTSAGWEQFVTSIFVGVAWYHQVNLSVGPEEGRFRNGGAAALSLRTLLKLVTWLQWRRLSLAVGRAVGVPGRKEARCVRLSAGSWWRQLRKGFQIWLGFWIFNVGLFSLTSRRRYCKYVHWLQGKVKLLLTVCLGVKHRLGFMTRRLLLFES